MHTEMAVKDTVQVKDNKDAISQSPIKKPEDICSRSTQVI